jgi:hypothetical protein
MFTTLSIDDTFSKILLLLVLTTLETMFETAERQLHPSENFP